MSHTSTLLQKKHTALSATADENNDGETILTSSPSNEQQPTTKTTTRKQPTLAELEDLEEARLAQEEEEEATKFNDGPSNLYNDVYSVTPKSISRIDNSGGGGEGEENNEDPLNISPQTEIRRAQARDTLQNTRLNEMFAEEDLQNIQRQQKIQALMDEDDKIWKEERRKKMMGKYANVNSWEEVEKMLEKDRKREVQGTFLLCIVCMLCFSGWVFYVWVFYVWVFYVWLYDCSHLMHFLYQSRPSTLTTHIEIETKVEIAKQSGVTLTMLEPAETMTSATSDNDESSNGNKSNFNPTIGIAGKSSWFANEDEMNIDLESEFQSLKDQSESTDDMSTPTASTTTAASESNDKEEAPRFVNGKLTSREQLMGISVGSAGGWSLEVFPGDFVVHRKYGIGRYEKTVLKPKTKLTDQEREDAETRRKEIINDLMKDGRQLEEIQRVVETFGTEKDTDPISNPLSTLLEIAYSDAVVHVPIDRAYRLSRYRAGDAAIKPRLSRVKGEAWIKAKRKVEVSTVQMAEDVLALYATRETLNRSPFDPSKEKEVKEFSKSFKFEPTPDQFKCFDDVENDMVWRSRPMDRLICGDVGFGKTEVAMRALFRSVANGRQAALLAPTGVLAAQHYRNIIKRMGEDTDHEFNIALLKGGMGKNTKKGRELRADIAEGKVDIVVGTHALLSNGMSFNDLGLLTVDEEQRFGVNQKERLKLICNCVDVLTLSATPIPRTLQMSLSGIRDTSTIRSPPPMRKPTISYVQEFEESLIRDAIERELARDGQCYYVVPRISQLEEAETLLKRIFPELRVIQAHGRMARGKAEENVAAFAEGNHDVLLATTVIENGVDIPRVNTIVIQNAQAFGMSTLYQLRGRVGRSDLQAYAYFFHKNDFLTEQSAQRLQAMADLSELGSGFDVANRDLEIRGAGSLLGTEQSGMAARVGFDLYMRMLKKSMRQLRGLDLPVVPRSNVLLPNGEGSIEWDDGTTSSSSYLIPESFIKDAKERSKEESLARLAESTQRLVEITNAWKDTYGSIPAELQSNLKSLHLHTCLRQLGIDVVGLDESTGDCILRSPGLRPRHWAMICSKLPKGSPPKGLDVIFPARFSFSEDDTEITGGQKIDLKELLGNPKYSDDDEEWDALDEEEVEAMKEISSAANVKDLSEVDIHGYPRFIVKGLGKSVKKGSRVDALLKVLLPPSKVVFKKQQKDKEKAKVAAELREKRELIAKQKKEQEKLNSRRMGYAQY